MAVSISVQTDVIDRVVSRLHLPTPGAGEFITDTEMLALVKSASRRLSGLLLRLFGDALFAETATLTTVPDFDLVSVPENLTTVRSIHWIDGDNAYLLERANVSDFFPVSQAWSHCNLPRYVLESNVIRLSPPPTQSYTVRLAYTTGLFVETAADTIQGGLGWDEWLIADICCKIREREQKPFDEFYRDRVEAEEQIKDQASQRQRFSATQVADKRGVTARERNKRRGWGY